MTINLTTAPNMFFPQVLAVDNGDPVNPIGTHALSRRKRGVVDPRTVWPQFSTIRISMRDMTQEQKQFTKDNINKWAPHVNLKFEFTEQQDGDIRIKGNNNLKGGSSYLGTDKPVDVDKPTMEIGFLGGLDEFNAGTVIHEFGHALGFDHEHQHPSQKLDINWEAIRKDTQNGKIDASFEENYLPLTKDVAFTPYDQKSVMHYGFPKEYLNSGEGIEDNNELSEGDKETARLFYPKPLPEPSLHCLLSAMRFSPSIRAILGLG